MPKPSSNNKYQIIMACKTTFGFIILQTEQCKIYCCNNTCQKVKH